MATFIKMYTYMHYSTNSKHNSIQYTVYLVLRKNFLDYLYDCKHEGILGMFLFNYMNLCKDNVSFRNIFNHWWASKKKCTCTFMCKYLWLFHSQDLYTHLTLITFPLFIKLNREGIIEEKGSEQCFVEWEWAKFDENWSIFYH